MKRKSHPQKNTLLKNAQANAEGNFFKRVFFSPPQENILLPLFFLAHINYLGDYAKSLYSLNKKNFTSTTPL